jgi:hypothetical protein
MAKQIRVTPDTLHNSLGGETVVMNLVSGEAFALDKVGQRIWELIQEHGDRDAVVEELMEQFKASTMEIGEDVDAFLEKLAAKGLLEVSA